MININEQVEVLGGEAEAKRQPTEGEFYKENDRKTERSDRFNFICGSLVGNCPQM